MIHFTMNRKSAEGTGKTLKDEEPLLSRFRRLGGYLNISRPSLRLLMTQGRGQHWRCRRRAAGRAGRSSPGPRRCPRMPCTLPPLLGMSGPLWLQLPPPTKKWGEIISPPSSECLKVVNQDLDFQGLDGTQERKTMVPRLWRQQQPGVRARLPWPLGTLMLSSSLSRCSSCFSSSATRIMFSFSRSRSFSVSCRMKRADPGLALQPRHSAQPDPQSGPEPTGRLAWWLPCIASLGPGSETT